MDITAIVASIRCRIAYHDEQAEFHDLYRTPKGVLVTLVNIMGDLGWSSSRKIRLDSRLPRSDESVGFLTEQRRPHLLVVAEAPGQLGTPPEMHKESRDLGFSYLAASNGRDWKFVDLQNGGMVSIRSMIESREAKRALMALSSTPEAGRHFEDLLSYAHILDNIEPALSLMLTHEKERLVPYLMKILGRRGTMLDIERVGDMLTSGLSSLDLLLNIEGSDTSNALAIDDLPVFQGVPIMQCAGLAEDEIGSGTAEDDERGVFASDFDPTGLTYVRPPSGRLGRNFRIEMVSRRRATLKAGSQITDAVSFMDKKGNPRAPAILAAHGRAMDIGKPLLGLDDNRKVCFVLTQDVPFDTPYGAISAIYGTSRNAGGTLCEEKTGKRWGIAIPSGDD